MRDFCEIVNDKGIPWVRHWIDATFEFSKNFVKSGTTEIDFEALGREEWEFRNALKTKDFSKNERAKYLWNEAMNIHNRNANNGKKSTGRPKKNTADGDIREDSQDIATSGNGSVTESGTSANPYGDAPRREAGEVVNSRESGALVPTTVSRNMRRVPQNEAPAHGFSGGRTAQGTMSRSPEAPAQSGKDYGPRLASIRSTDDTQPEGLTGPSHGGSVASLEARQGLALESQRRAGGNSLRVAKVRTPPVRSSGPMPADKQPVLDFAADKGLDADDAYNCWYATVNERDGLTADGKPIKNWKAYVRKWCETRAGRRNA